jgi:hypothetical protein
MDLIALVTRKKRYGTPPPPGRMGTPWWWIPSGTADARKMVTAPRFYKRAAVGSLGFLVLIIALVIVNLPPPLPPIGPVNQLSSNFGTISLRSPLGWSIAGFNQTLATPIIFFAPQADPDVPPITITLAQVDVSAAYSRETSLNPSADPRTLLYNVVNDYASGVGLGNYCTLDLTYNIAASITNQVPPALEIHWLETRPYGWQAQAGSNTNKGACDKNNDKITTVTLTPPPSGAAPPPATPTSLPAAVTPGPVTSVNPPAAAWCGIFTACPGEGANPAATPAASLSFAPLPTLLPYATPQKIDYKGTSMVAEQWFALPSFSGFQDVATQKMLIITLMYPANLASGDIANIKSVYDTMVASVGPGL